MSKKQLTTLAAANALAVLAVDNGNLVPGVIAAANAASRFEADNANDELTAYGVGYFEENDLFALLEAIAPGVPAPMRFSFRRGTNAEYFLSDSDDIRAIGADFKRVQYSGDEQESRLHNKGLTVRLDHDAEGATEAKLQRTVRLLINRLLRSELRRAIALLEANDTNANRTWNPAADPLVNPYSHLRADVQSFQTAVGIYPNVQVWGRTAWNYLQDLVEAHDGAIGGMSPTPENVANRLGLERIILVDPVYTTASGKSKILGNGIFTYYAMQDPEMDDPSSIKRFVSEELGDGGLRVYVEPHAKYTDVSVEHYSRQIATSADGIRKSTAANS
ncbi:MAG: hypothetical protein ACQKBU_04520 [Verrucomicrobiales bacterium]